MKPYVLALLTMASVAGPASAEPSNAPGDQPQAHGAARETECEFAAEFVKTWVRDVAGRPTVLSDRPVEIPSLISRPDKMTDVWKARGPTNAFSACPELRSILPANFRFATEADWAGVERLGSGSGLMIAAIAAPFLSEDGKSIMIQYSWSCAGLCGGGWVKRYRRSRAAWSSGAEILAIWIS